ncbi:MAG TPA: pyrroloquinoline quinone-dependent dehydrogenase [Vicinamibacterales bacterium]|nr:pyrroloquinoline quinone-dependent dehydrogenase [Vicinamibacterales bacterium]
MSRGSRRLSLAVFTFVVGLVAAAAWPSAQPAQKNPVSAGTSNGEWPTYAGDLRGTRYSPLDEITAANFNDLEVAWRFKTDSLGNRPEFKLEGTPLMVGGVLYATAGTRRAVVALDAATGELLWVHGEREGARGAAAPRQLSGRGLAYWSDGREERILYVTPGYRLIALDAKTGMRVASFGKDGVVDLKLEADQEIKPDLTTGEIGLQSAPIVAKDTIIIGAAFREGMTPKSHRNNKGFVRGYDVRTGKRLWIFHTIPMKGEFAYDTWENGSAEYTGNTGVWAQITVDEELGLVYLPVESPTGDFYGGHRPGNNLFGESLVCVDLKTGQRKWHFQLIHHPLWDHDVSSAPILADIVVDGRPIKAVALPSKQSFLYMFDRVSGKPVWTIDERPVEKGDVPGEWYAPTQPFPTRPPAYARNGTFVDDLIDFTPELRAEALKVVSKYKLGPIFTPPVVSRLEGPLATLTMATASGGTNWPGGSYDPETRTAYLYACNACPTAIGLMPPPSKEISDMRYVLGIAGQEFRVRMGPGENAGADSPPPPRPQPTSNAAAESGAAARGAAPGAAAAPARPAATGGGGLNVQGLPLFKPPYGTITAISLDRGEIVWQVPHGETPDLIRNHPALKGRDIPRTGQTGYNVGTLVTKTLVIAGEGQVTTVGDRPRGAMLRAYDKKTGQEVGAVWIPAPQSGSPMTYRLNGRQYLVVAVSGGPYSGEYIAFALPAEGRAPTTSQRP